MNQVRTPSTPTKEHILFIGAHPDDAEIEMGGTALLSLAKGHEVTFLSLTKGDAGHQTLARDEIAQRRKKEVTSVAQKLGIRYDIWDIPDAELEVTLANRYRLIRYIRSLQPTVIVTHRPAEYHVDHRNTSQLVQDAAYLIAVPRICEDVPPLSYNPIILFHQDNFKRPYPLDPSVIVDITSVIDKKMELLSLHESQMFEWAPWIEGYQGVVPSAPKERLAWLLSQYGNWQQVNQFLPLAKPYVSVDTYQKIKHIEVFEVSEYGGHCSKEDCARIFPFGTWVKDSTEESGGKTPRWQAE